MRRYSQRSSLSTVSEINITPLLDLAFVLLIIFIITTPLLEQSTTLQVPTSGASAGRVDPAQVLTISIDRATVLKLDNQLVEMSNLPTRLSEARQRNEELSVVIRPDRELPVQRLIDVMDAVQQAQITRIGVATLPQTAP